MPRSFHPQVANHKINIFGGTIWKMSLGNQHNISLDQMLFSFVVTKFEPVLSSYKYEIWVLKDEVRLRDNFT
jgi:hypothetical protein